MRGMENEPVSGGQMAKLLRARGEEAERYQRGLAMLLRGYAVPDVEQLPVASLVGHMVDLEGAQKGRFGRVVGSIIGQTPIEEPESHTIARCVMQRNFLGMPEIARGFGLNEMGGMLGMITPEVGLAFKERIIPFDPDILRSCRETHVLVADSGISIADMYGRMRNMMSSDVGDLDDFAYAREKPCWRLIRKTPLEGSLNRGRMRGKALLGEHDEMLRARHVAYMALLMAATTGERLFQDVCVWTEDKDYYGMPIYVGRFGDAGLRVDRHLGDDDYTGMAMGAARKYFLSK